MKASIELSNEDIQQAVSEYIQKKLHIQVDSDEVKIQSKGGYYGTDKWSVYSLRTIFLAKPKQEIAT